MHDPVLVQKEGGIECVSVPAGLVLCVCCLDFTLDLRSCQKRCLCTPTLRTPRPSSLTAPYPLGKCGIPVLLAIVAVGDFEDLVLTCSMDWSCKLWSHRRSRDRMYSRCLFSFDEYQEYVSDVQWSPVQPAVFASVDGRGMGFALHAICEYHWRVLPCPNARSAFWGRGWAMRRGKGQSRGRVRG